MKNKFDKEDAHNENSDNNIKLAIETGDDNHEKTVKKH
jgi:hypothetical protein